MNPNNYKNQKSRGLKRKIQAITKLGGKCSKCGYDKNIAALEFHHKDPKEKEFQLDVRHFSNVNIEKLNKELDKCDLLCSNCHRETHNPELELKSIIIDNKKSGLDKTYGSECPICNSKFPKMKGKIFCSNECFNKSKGYPTINELIEKYNELKSWDKVALQFNVTRKIIQTIRKTGM